MNPTPIDPSNTFDWLKDKVGMRPSQATAWDVALLAVSILAVVSFYQDVPQLFPTIVIVVASVVGMASAGGLLNRWFL